MKVFMDHNFLLETKTAQELFHNTACCLPVIDFHNHLSPKEIWLNQCYRNLTEVWLLGDHYKWRAMRANGISEKYITGNGDPYEKFLAWADTVQNCIGNPLYHWTHLELQRYFGIKILCTKIGNWVENGEYPNDPAYLKQLVQNICHDNAKQFFQF